MSTQVGSGRRVFSLKALASLMLGALAIGASLVNGAPAPQVMVVLILTLCVLALLLGVGARRQIRRSNGGVRGSGAAAWGIALMIVAICVALLPQRSYCTGMRPAAALNNLKQIGLALEDYHRDHGRFPPSVVYSPEGSPLCSWRVLILPYLDQKELYDAFNLNEAWDGPHNRELLARRPAVYDTVGVVAESSMTYSQVFNGKGAAFEGRQGTTLADFPDSPERTLLVVEAGEPVPWTKPIDLPYPGAANLPALGGVFKGGSGLFGIGGTDGCNVVFADATARFIPRRKLAKPALRALITRNGNESTNGFQF
jgi:hypothetical protein